MKQTTLCYIDDGERYLMLHRVKKKNDASHGKWIGVGGKCEADEAPDECMLREVREETGLAVTRWRYRGIVTFISDTWDNEYMHLFTATEWQDEPDMGIDDEGELAWIAKSDLPIADGVGNPTINLWEGDKLFLRLLLDEQQPFFSMKLVYIQDELVNATLFGAQATSLRIIADKLSTPQTNPQNVADKLSAPQTSPQNVADKLSASQTNLSPQTPQNHCRNYIPHFEVKKTQFITYRLADSLPSELIEECRSLLDIKNAGEELKVRQRKLKLLVDQYEDAGLGECVLKDARVAAIIIDNLRHHDGIKYQLLHWCIMPNHIHLLIEILGDHTMSDIMHSLRSYTANEINRLLGRSGTLWMPEYYDRYIRDQRHYEIATNYILNNPVKAGLAQRPEEWPWCG